MSDLQLEYSKEKLLDDYRNVGKNALLNAELSSSAHKQNAKKVNNSIVKRREEILKAYEERIADTGATEGQLSDVLMINYTSYVAMLEYRNQAWPYEYMAFSRRIGELWEPFCKLPFAYPVNDLELYDPPNFSSVKHTIVEEFADYVEALDLEKEDREYIQESYSGVWGYVESGDINLSLDLHFEQNEVRYAVDYKSGFGSNEKGNTNRLLMVGSVYQQLPGPYKNLIFVRQEQDKNNNYLKKLQSSPFWDAYCAEEAYDKIREFSGFDLNAWMLKHMNWEDDISPEFRKYVLSNNLEGYLTW